MQTTPTQTNKLHRQLIAGVALSLALAPACGPAAQAKEDSVFLLETSVRQHRLWTVAQECFRYLSSG
ncbi:MAG: hypothetical protein KME26_10645 [Oscillatoria princeps RMCB-10]|jgi:hypothetical protein|nr:hypothetical protein [Oscillatoria princeps RMCB-10]